MDFSTLAIQKLLEVFPELAAYVVSFNDLSDELPSEDTNVKAGVLVLQFGQGFNYIPVIAAGEVIQPFDSIFLTGEGQFHPLTKTLVHALSANMTIEPGQAERIPSTATINPSIYDLVVPPRTGKFVYASSSRLTEFLASMPNEVKKEVLEKVASDQTLYQNLHDLFTLPDIMSALRPTEIVRKEIKAGPTGIKVITNGENLADDVVQEIISKGYALRGENQTNRIAVNVRDATHNSRLSTLSNTASGKDSEIVFWNGQTAVGFFPKKSVLASKKMAALLGSYGSREFKLTEEECFVIFGDGSYINASQAVAVGEQIDGLGTFKELSLNGRVGKFSDVRRGDHIALLDTNLGLIGKYHIEDVSISSNGVFVRTNREAIMAIPGLKSIDSSVPEKLLIPTNAVVVKLGKNRSSELETNVGAAAAYMELKFMDTLGSYSNLGYDGCEFSYNGGRVGPEAKVMEILVVKEGIAPSKASEFVKQAMETGSVKFFMSKQASETDGGIPSYGEAPMPQDEMWNMQGQSIDAINAAAQTRDVQVAETAIITELLQAPSMTEYVSEYLPDIKVCLDRLGRIIFLSRMNYDKLSASINATEVLSFVNNLRNVYKSLGDSYLKLQSLANISTETESAHG